MLNKVLFGASFFGMTAVMLGAFGAHALRAKLTPEALAVWQTAVQYQFYHALGLLLVAVLLRQDEGVWLRAGAVAFAAGILLFSGSLYGLALGGPRWLGPVTPLGGLAFILGWACLAISAWK